MLRAEREMLLKPLQQLFKPIAQVLPHGGIRIRFRAWAEALGKILMPVRRQGAGCGNPVIVKPIKYQNLVLLYGVDQKRNACALRDPEVKSHVLEAPSQQHFRVRLGHIGGRLVQAIQFGAGALQFPPLWLASIARKKARRLRFQTLANRPKTPDVCRCRNSNSRADTRDVLNEVLALQASQGVVDRHGTHSQFDRKFSTPDLGSEWIIGPQNPVADDSVRPLRQGRFAGVARTSWHLLWVPWRWRQEGSGIVSHIFYYNTTDGF